METSSIYRVRKFVNQRLTAAVEEIFGVFEKALLEYEEEIARQRKLLDIVLKPQIKLRKTDLPQPSICEEVQTGVPLNQERSLDEEDPEPPQIKEEQEELCTSQDEEQFALQQHTEALKLSPTYDGCDYNEDQTLLFNPVQTQSAVEKEPQSDSERMQPEPDRKHSVDTEPNSDPDQHIKADKKLYQCTICGKNFKMNTDLELHMRTHTGKKLYSCKFCKKEFAFSSSVSRHLRVHTGEKPYECLMCGKRFNVSTTLKVHYRIHTGERPYKCKTCERSFTTCSNLKKHMALHNKVAKSRPVKSCHCITNVTGNHNEMV